MSANTIRKAKKLVESGGVQKIDDDIDDAIEQMKYTTALPV